MIKTSRILVSSEQDLDDFSTAHEGESWPKAKWEELIPKDTLSVDAWASKGYLVEDPKSPGQFIMRNYKG